MQQCAAIQNPDVFEVMQEGHVIIMLTSFDAVIISKAVIFLLEYNF